MVAPKTNLQKAETAIKRAEASLANARRDLEQAVLEEKRAARPEPATDGAVIRFRKQYIGGSRIYDFAAIRAGGYWYLTGLEGARKRTWSALLDFIDEGGEGFSPMVAAGYEPLNGLHLTEERPF